uniref:V-set and immunoglobulin domain containing 8 n=1 Tax=Strigops habroptila TaxID=2489341 RepID=A0A672UXG6_STRHB
MRPMGAVLSPAFLLAVRINSKGREVLYLAKGDSVKLGCPYVLEPEDNGPQGVGIEWIQITPERTGPENVFLSYQDHHVNYGSGSGLQDRVAFVQTDPSQYDASIRLADLQVSDTGTYQCRVKKNTVAVHEVIVTVQEKPVTPQCWTEGELIEGGSILLRCYSRGGTSPLAYQWAKLADGYGGGRLPSGTIQGGSPGDLFIRSLTEAHAGVYQCRVTNRVGYSVCQLNLSPSASECRRGGGWGHGGGDTGTHGRGTERHTGKGKEHTGKGQRYKGRGQGYTGKEQGHTGKGQGHARGTGTHREGTGHAGGTGTHKEGTEIQGKGTGAHREGTETHGEGTGSGRGHRDTRGGGIQGHTGVALAGCWGRGDQWQPARRPAVTGCARTVGGRQAGIIVGSILGSLLLLSLPALLIWALICRYRRKECQRACSDCR